MPPEPLFITPPGNAAFISITGGKKFSWLSEFMHLFSRKSLSILWWPIFKLRERELLKTPVFKTCKKLPGFRDLWRNIRFGSFAYNNLFLRISPMHRSTILADVLTLALFFGDEFIDGVTETVGKQKIRDAVLNSRIPLYMRKRKWKGKYVVFFAHIDRIISKEILQTINPRYQITYGQFLHLLVQMVEWMNNSLSKLPEKTADEASSKIVSSANSCLESFYHDVNSSEYIRRPEEVMKFHEQKTAVMLYRLLELRSVLVNRPGFNKNIQTPGWLDVMRVVQIYDDIQDVVTDFNKQDNIVISVAAHLYPGEWKWFIKNKELLNAETHLLYLFTYLPATMEYCQRLAAEKIKSMNWEQQKIMHYLIRKATGKLFTQNENCGEYLMPDVFYMRVKDKMVHLRDQEVRAFVIDCLMHFRSGRKKICRYLSLTDKYQLLYNLMLVSPEEKVKIFTQLENKNFL